MSNQYIVNGNPLVKLDNVFFKDVYTDDMYMLKNEKMILLKNPLDGSRLVPGNNGFFHSVTDNMQFRLMDNGTFSPIRDPYTGGYLIPLDNGLFYSNYLDGNFMYDEAKKMYIPLFIDDLTKEEAHVEGDFLVGNKSGRKFPILPSGYVLLIYEEPKDLKIEDIENEKKRLFNMSQAEINRNLNVNYFNYKNEELDEIDRKLYEERKAVINEGNALIEKMWDDARKQMEERQKKLDDFCAIVDKVYKDYPITNDEVFRLQHYVREGIISIEDYNTVVERGQKNSAGSRRI